MTQLHLADCREVMAAMPANSVDSIISDPPYELAFMGAKWDSTGIAFDRTVWTEAIRVLKPGGYVLAFGATRTWHWLACALELCGFESRGSIAWIQGQGMQHGLDISKAMDADAGAERDVVGVNPSSRPNSKKVGGAGFDRSEGKGGAGVQLITAPATEEAREWAGWGTQLAPKHEPIAMFRKPLEGTYVENIRAHGVGGLNIDGCRLGGEPWKGPAVPGKRPPHFMDVGSGRGDPVPNGTPHDLGRWPPNVVLDEAVQAQLDAMVGKRTNGGQNASSRRAAGRGGIYGEYGDRGPTRFAGSSTGPSAFFYCPKAPTGERDRGCEHLRWVREGSGWRPSEAGEKPELVGNCWATVKPLELMRWLVRLVTPPSGLVLDPFLGSGTTGVAAVCEGMRFVGSDLSPVAHMIADARIRWAKGRGPSIVDLPAGTGGQSSLF